MLGARITELETLRYTPAGIPAIEFRVAHVSEQIEAGAAREVRCELPCVALGPTAQLLVAARPGDGVRLAGFLAAKSLKSRTPVLHVNELQFVEGMSHGV